MDHEQQKDKLKQLLSVMKTLRSPQGCPWDREQTHKTLKPFLMEECGELLDAIEDDDAEGMQEELGDILMHVVLHSVMAEERGAFTFEDVAKSAVEKMIRRHPHVFGEANANTSQEVIGLWEQVKKEEKKKDRISVLDGIPRHCPALLQAEKMQKRAAKCGFDWDKAGQIIDKIEEELEELRVALKNNKAEEIDEETGDLLFAVVNLSRFIGRASAEELLANANSKFMKRFKHIEKKMKEADKKMTHENLALMEGFWNEAKKLS